MSISKSFMIFEMIQPKSKNLKVAGPLQSDCHQEVTRGAKICPTISEQPAHRHGSCNVTANRAEGRGVGGERGSS